MKRIAALFAVVMLATTLASVATANACTPRIDRREARQHARIREGVRQGDLTPGEAHRLRQGQRHVDRMEDRAKADGRVSLRERARIKHAQNRQSRRIFRMRHNGV